MSSFYPRAVFFDLDDTLYDYEGVNHDAVRNLGDRVEREIGIPAAEVVESYFRILREQKLQTPSTAGYHNRTIRFQRLLEERHLPLRHAVGLGEAYWDELFKLIHPFDGVPEALDALRARGLTLGICTNMTAIEQLRKVERLGLLDRFDLFVSSEEAGSEKPDPGIFLLTAKKAGCDPGECLFIGDLLKTDINGALGAGMKVLWFQPDPARRAEHPEIPSFASYRDLDTLVAGSLTVAQTKADCR